MILGTRGSPLALKQSEWVRERLAAAHPGLPVAIRVIRTQGDSRPSLPLAAGDTERIFVKEIEEALLDRRIDLAVHSLKDLPTEEVAGLIVGAVPAREDPRDVLVTRGDWSLRTLPPSARVGTGSPRRAAQILAVRSDLIVTPVRGNVGTRIGRVTSGDLEAVALAAAGLRRLGLIDSEVDDVMAGARVHLLPVDECTPAVGQGALAVQIRGDEAETRRLVSAIHDPMSGLEVEAERAFLAALGGGCRVPVAALARAGDGELTMIGMVAAPDGSTVVRVSGQGAAAGARDLGERLARQALDRGAGGILAGAGTP